MSLDGLRAWIGVVERKLAMRTRVFLVLAAITVGGAGAAIYLAIDAQNNSVSKADVQAVREELEEQSGGATGEGNVAQLEAELESLRAEVAALGGAEAGGGQSSGGTSGGGSGGAAVPKNQKQLQELVEKATEQAGK
jgi:hypothetical protein